MNYTEIIENGRQVYTSIPSDSRLRKWLLNNYQLGISYYTQFPLTPIDKLICSLLSNANGQMGKKELGLTLGFNIATTDFQGQPFYIDVAEVEMFNRLLNQLIDWNLIVNQQVENNTPDFENEENDKDNEEKNLGDNVNVISDDIVRITKVGKIALEKNIKFSFYHADATIYVNFLGTGDTSVDHAFPYLQELGIKANINNSKINIINPDDIDLEASSEWIDRLSFQLDPNWEGHIYGVVPQNKTLPMAYAYVDFKLYEYNGAYHLLAFKDSFFCKTTTDILNAEVNIQAKNLRVKKCLYYKMINDKDASFVYDEVIPFWDYLEEDEYNLMLKDQRVDWSDTSLFKLIVESEYCSTQTWSTISNLCPISVIKEYIVQYDQNFDWLILSLRMEIEFILTAPNYPWNYSTILDRNDISKEQAQTILLLPVSDNVEWEWDSLEKFLTIDFVKNNINNLNVDFYHLTSWLPKENLNLILENSEKSWNWDKATKEFSLQQIVENISILKHHINIMYLLDRCFEDVPNIDFVIHSVELKNYIRDAIQNGKLNSFSLREKSQYLWTDETISYLENIGLLNWTSKLYEKGFAQYPFVKWTPEFFAKYHDKLTESEDRTYVSRCIEDMSIISYYPNFEWDWSALSSNQQIAYSDSFISHYAPNIDSSSWIQFAQPQMIERYFEQLNLESLLRNVDYAIDLSTKVSKDFIKSHISLPWDNTVFTEVYGREAIDDLFILHEYSSRWDWELLSSIVPNTIVLENIDLPWECAALSRAICLSESETVSLIDKFKNKLDWSILSQFIEYVDFEDVAENYTDKWIWTTINNRFASSFSCELVARESIQEHINWEIISQQMQPLELSKLIALIPERLNWEYVTQRLCVAVTIEELLDENNVQKWEWDYLSSEAPVNLLIEGLPYSQLLWNWDIVSQRLDSGFILENLVTYQEKWNWSIVWKNKFTYAFVRDKIQEVSEILNQLGDSVRVLQWNAFTRVFGAEELLKLTNQLAPGDGYNWDFKYVYENIQDISKFVSESHVYIDWSALSCCSAANAYFHYDSDIFDARIWKSMAKKRLEDPIFKWDFKSLTKLDSIQRGYQLFFKITEEAWDWDFISAEGYCLKAANNGEANLRKYKHRINFALLSKREDAGLSEQLIESFIDEAWDWSALSENQNIQLSISFISKYKEKDWDWTAISKNTSIYWDTPPQKNVYSNLFKDKSVIKAFDWESFVAREDIRFDNSIISNIWKNITNYWTTLSSNKRFIPSVEVLEYAKRDNVDLKSLDWECISGSRYLITLTKKEGGHSTPDLTFVKEHADYLNWKLVTQNQMFDIYNDEIIDEFKLYIDWSFVSEELENEKLSIFYLDKFKKYLDWSIINNRIDYQIINEDALKRLADYLDWEKVSQLELPYTKQLLDAYADKWYWRTLLRNEAFIRIQNDEMLAPYKAKLNVAEFFDRFGHKSVKIYHFTHLFNVLEVLKSKKILSRNSALELSKLKFDSAGSVVGRTEKAHSFARFYFRPNTPTQFYNECLGWDSDMTISNGNSTKSYYSQALNLGLPKCPMPVFLEFDLEEVLAKMPSICYYSNGNMQTNRASVFKVDATPANLQMEYLYNNMSDAKEITIHSSSNGWDLGMFHNIQTRIKDQSQQEFLVKNEFDFSKVTSLKIHCYDENTARMLRDYLGDDEIAKNIVVGGCFLYRNRYLDFDFNDEEQTMSVMSNYNGHGDAYFLVKGNVEILNSENIKRQVSEGLIMYPMVKISTNDKPCEIYFIDQRARTKEWLIYSNVKSNDINGKKNTNQVLKELSRLEYKEKIVHLCETFPIEMNKLDLKLDSSLFHRDLIKSWHGIGHTARVLFISYLLVNANGEMSESEKQACYYAAIIHDLAKTNDREGEMHGFNSAKRYESTIRSIVQNEELQNRILRAVRYHSVDDNKCPADCKSDVIWKVLKDADALDRSRFGGRGCDRNYLRLSVYKKPIGDSIFELSSYLPGWTLNCQWINPYSELSESIKKFIE